MTARNAMTKLTWITLFLFLILAAAGLLIPTLTFFLLVFGGALFGIFVYGIVEWIQNRTHWSQKICFGIVMGSILLITFSGAWFLGSRVLEQMSQLWSQMDDSISQVKGWLAEQEWAKAYLPNNGDLKNALQNGKATSWLIMGASHMGSTVGSIGTAIGGGLLMFCLGAYLAYEPSLYMNGALKLLPQDRRERGREVLVQLSRVLRGWIRGQLMSMSIIGIFTMVGLWLLGMPLPITLGVLSAILTFIPNIGPVLAAVPQSLLALKFGPMMVVYIILFNIALQTVESYFVTPIVQQHEADLPPALTIVFQLLTTFYFGILGASLGAPLLAAVMTIIQMLYISDYMGDPKPGKMSSR